MAIFVMDEQHRHFGDAQRLQRVHRVKLIRNDGSAADEAAQVDAFAAKQGDGDVACLHHADQFFDRARADWQAGVRRGDEPFANGIGISVGVDPVDFGARRHDFTHRPVGEADDARDDGALAFLDDARATGFGDDEVQFLRRHLILAFAVEAERGKDQRAGAIEQPDEGRGQPGDPLHRDGGKRSDGFGRAQGELFGHQFADDQRQIGGQRNDKDEAEGFGKF